MKHQQHTCTSQKRCAVHGSWTKHTNSFPSSFDSLLASQTKWGANNRILTRSTTHCHKSCHQNSFVFVIFLWVNTISALTNYKRSDNGILSKIRYRHVQLRSCLSSSVKIVGTCDVEGILSLDTPWNTFDQLINLFLHQSGLKRKLSKLKICLW